MNFFYRLQEWFIWLTNILVDAAMFCYNFGFPLTYLGDFFRWLSDGTAAVAGYMWDGAQWWKKIETLIKDILSWDTIKALLRSWLPGIESLISWFSDWWYWIEKKVNDWWKVVQVTVKGWIDAATEGFEELVEAWNKFWKVTWPEWTKKLTELRALWDDFWTTIFPTLLTFTWLTKWWNDRLKEIDILIDSTIRVWFPFYDDLVKLWSEIRAFFVDPLQWCYNKLDDFFERFW